MSNSTTAAGAVPMSGGNVGGNLYIRDTGATANISGGTVDGSSNLIDILANHVIKVGQPEFPTPDTDRFKDYATNNYVAGAKTQQNIRIPANTNPQFAGGDTVQGIMYVESPNKITFRGNFNLQGFIVFQDTHDPRKNSM